MAIPPGVMTLTNPDDPMRTVAVALVVEIKDTIAEFPPKVTFMGL